MDVRGDFKGLHKAQLQELVQGRDRLKEAMIKKLHDQKENPTPKTKVFHEQSF